MSDYHNNKPFKPTKSGIAKKVIGTVTDFFKSRGKNITPGVAINKVNPNVPKTKLDKAKSKLAIATQKTKASTAKLGQTIFESKNKAFKGKDFTFATKKGKSESNKEAYKRIQGENTKVLKGMIDDAFKEKKAKGGRVGLKFGSKKKSNVQKIQETFGPKKQLSPKQMKIAKLAGNPKKIDAQDLAKLRGRG